MKPFDRRYLVGNVDRKDGQFYLLRDASPALSNQINQPQQSNFMNVDQVQGTVNTVAGRIQDAAGALTGDADQQVKGKAHAEAGDVQAKAGDIVERFSEWAAERPVNAVLIAAGVAFLLGRITASRD
ncbi:uncharacterized protein YjbJ (UPF0337 family) [Rhodanobacter sp. K2T2]|uniref:CsbD family protein n=1 Tax=Rhodanobacter sp. K2T2 TaxID=2723085 RepID=UPI0015CD4733|nr:CsbD family protein [Rhodanobacter sp. K2T2]NYE30054.1 uncharacterized protein YjbJ (UPF0337 family) [Rhodanobacter sp. K2T2]